MKKRTRRDQDLERAEIYIVNTEDRKELKRLRDLIDCQSCLLDLRDTDKRLEPGKIPTKQRIQLGVKKGLAKMRRRRQK